MITITQQYEQLNSLIPKLSGKSGKRAKVTGISGEDFEEAGGN